MKTPFQPRRLPALALGGTVIGLAAACGLSATQAGTGGQDAGRDPVRCEIRIDDTQGATAIEGRVDADRPIRGHYRLSIASRSAGGSSTIDQSGEFQAAPGAPAILGQTTLGGSPGQYSAALDVDVEGARLRCTNGAHRL
ncbi:MAG: hypothetical protein HLUCCA12_16270 [Rhodobacteraceae bacterium HLUCCA12]|nr:MAG: hypothetical protein HLUCCA12_16270 [Rhodobacteraceae bacterium HLUCCA12]